MLFQIQSYTKKYTATLPCNSTLFTKVSVESAGRQLKSLRRNERTVITCSINISIRISSMPVAFLWQADTAHESRFWKLPRSASQGTPAISSLPGPTYAGTQRSSRAEYSCERFEVPTAMPMKITVFCDATPHSLAEVQRRFWEHPSRWNNDSSSPTLLLWSWSLHAPEKSR